MVDCLTDCKYIIDEMAPILDEIKKLKEEHVNKVYSEEDLKKSNELDKQLEQIQYRYNECRIDCERRNRHRVSDEEQQPIDVDEKLRKELKKLDESDDDPFDGGNKRQSRRRRRRRCSIRNKTKQKHSRRHTRNARRRGRGQRTRRHKK